MHDLTPLYEYIHSQRRAGLSDATTYHNLISAGWAPEIVSQAMNNQSHQSAAPQHYQNAVYQQTHQQPVQQHSAATAAQRHQTKGLFVGRINRLEFLMGNVYILLAMAGLFGITLFTSLAFDSVVFLIFNFFLFIAGGVAAIVFTLGLYARRWHDLDQTGWFALFWLAVGIILVVILSIVKGNAGSNQYGQAPTKNLSPKAIFGF